MSPPAATPATRSPPAGGGPSPNFAAAAPIQTAPSTSDDLPRAHVKRIMKHQLAKFAHVDAKTNAPFEPHIAKDALDGVQQACKIFIHYVTSTANDICTESKRSTLSAVRSRSDDTCDGFFEFFPHTFGCRALSTRVACLRRLLSLGRSTFTSKEER